MYLKKKLLVRDPIELPWQKLLTYSKINMLRGSTKIPQYMNNMLRCSSKNPYFNSEKMI